MNVPLASLTIICFLLTLVFRCLIYFYALMGNEKKSSINNLCAYIIAIALQVFYGLFHENYFLENYFSKLFQIYF